MLATSGGTISIIAKYIMEINSKYTVKILRPFLFFCKNEIPLFSRSLSMPEHGILSRYASTNPDINGLSTLKIHPNQPITKSKLTIKLKANIMAHASRKYDTNILN